MEERQIMDGYLAGQYCPSCHRKKTMTITSERTLDRLWNWECSYCKGTGNVGYNLYEIPWIDLPPDKEKELKDGLVENWHEFIKKWGVERPKTQICLNQDPSLY